MQPLLTKIEIINYRSCKRAAVELHPKLSVLIGPNGSGKSNFLNGIQLLKKVSHSPVRYRDDEPLLSECKLKATFSIENKPVFYEALIRYATNDRNLDDVVGASERWNFREITGDTRWLTLPISAATQLESLSTTSAYTRVLRERTIYQITEIMNGGRWTTEMVEHVLPYYRQAVDFVEGISYYSASQFTDPSKCPTYFEVEEDKPFRRARFDSPSHAQFMFDLYATYKNSAPEFAEFTSIVGAGGVGIIDELTYSEVDVPSSKYQVMAGARFVSKEVKKRLIIPTVQLRGTQLSPNQLSEGTFKTLAVIYYLVTDKSRLLLLEEPEVCVHQGLLASIIELVKSYSSRKQIVISTHSGYVLDALTPENVFTVRNDVEKGTLVRHIRSAMSKREFSALKEYLQVSGNLGEFWRHGELEK